MTSLHTALPRRTPARRLSAGRVTVVGYLLLILVGALLLYLPASRNEAVQLSFLDCLFTATSAATLTGMITVSTAETWSLLGKIILMLLIQLGAWGYMSAAAFVAYRLGLRMGFQNQTSMTAGLRGYLQHRSIWRILRYTLYISLIIEAFGFLLLLMLSLFKLLPGSNSAFGALFYAVSAFCNAGFDLAPGFDSLTAPATSSNAGFLIILSLLSLLGGLGISVIVEIVNRARGRRFGLHAKMVLSTTVILLLLGATLIILFEMPNPHSPFTGRHPGAQALHAGFLALNSRSTGFSTVDVTSLSPPSQLLVLLQMFIGGAPGSAAGGVKVITFTVILLAIATLLRRQSDIEVFQRRIGGEVVRQALSLVVIALTAVLFVTLCISWIEITRVALPTSSETTSYFTRIGFEVMSAFGNVGFKTGLAATLHPASQALLALAMLVGRIGPLFFFYQFSQAKKPTLRRLPSEAVMTG